MFWWILPTVLCLTGGIRGANREGCCSFKNTCVGVGQTYTDGCIVYKCTSGSSTVSIQDWGCARDGKCYPPNAAITDRCRTQTCQNINGKVGFRNTEQGCVFRDKCLKLGEIVEESCLTYKCQAQTIQGVEGYIAARISTKCQDSDGNCREPGSIFSLNTGGQIRQKCTCTLEGSKIRYGCAKQ